MNLVQNPHFDNVMGVFLMLNALSTGIQVNHMADKVSENPPLGFRVVDWCFVFIFTAELCVRLKAFGLKMYLVQAGMARRWAFFDTVVVCFQIVDELAMLLLTATSTAGAITNSLTVFLRILRLGRILRLMRLVRLISELRTMTYLITASMNAFFWTMVLLVLMMFCISIYFTEAAAAIAKK